MTDAVQTKREIQALLQAAGLRPTKRFGQNFLIDGNLMRKLVAAARIDPDDVVLEVGGGTGGLTDLLATRARRVIVAEIDRGLAELLTQRFGDRSNVSVLHRDALRSKHLIDPVISAELARAAADGGGAVLLVANLPYNVASPLMMNLLTAEPPVNRMCVTIQSEVADKIMAAPGSKDCGPLAICMQLTGHTERVARLPAQAFWPAPEVESAIIRIERRPHPFGTADRLGGFMALVRAAFAHRRKTLFFNLGRHLNRADLDRVGAHTDLGRRAETLSLDEWVEMGLTILG